MAEATHRGFHLVALDLAADTISVRLHKNGASENQGRPLINGRLSSL